MPEHLKVHGSTLYPFGCVMFGEKRIDIMDSDAILDPLCSSECSVYSRSHKSVVHITKDSVTLSHVPETNCKLQLK
jgi:hypothetical protein